MSCLHYKHDVRLSITLVDCDNTAQEKVEMGTWQNKLVSWLPAHGS